METILSLQFIFRPNYWIQNEKYNDYWDKTLKELLEKYNFEYIDAHKAKLGPNYIIWTTNRPYSCMMPVSSNGETADFRASRLTICRAIEKYKRQIKHLPLEENEVLKYKQD